jgi:hypothetical protein
MNSRADEQEARTSKEMTRGGYEAGWLRASGHLTAKLSRPKSQRVDPTVVRGNSTNPYLGRSRLTPERVAPVERPNGARSQQRP